MLCLSILAHLDTVQRALLPASRLAGSQESEFDIPQAISDRRNALRLSKEDPLHFLPDGF